MKIDKAWVNMHTWWPIGSQFQPVVLLMTLIFAMSVMASTAAGQHYEQTNLVSDIPGLAALTDNNLVNPWGLTASSASPWWISNNGTGTSELFNGTGQPFPLGNPLTVTVPSASGPPDQGTPTGVVFNGSNSDFSVGVNNMGANLPARFIFVTEDGTISGWNPMADPTNAILKPNNSGTAGYKGAAIGQMNSSNFLYVANFKAGTVDVFDANFSPVTLPAGAFVDPELPAGFAPFNVQNVGGNIFVCYAMQDEEKHDEVAGDGLGYVDEFDTSGHLLMSLKHGKWMNAPWAVVWAPGDFGQLSNHILVGNFGSGRIAAFDPKHGNFHGFLRGRFGIPLTIDGLWALGFGNGANAGPTNTLFFTAGIDDEQHGLFGAITPAPNGEKEGENNAENQGENSGHH